MNFASIPLIQIAIGPNNPRKHFDEKSQAELAASVQKFGVLQPIIVRPDADGFELVCGERRFRAATTAGLEEIPAIVRELTDDEAFDLQITENLQRKDINPMEEADAFSAIAKRKKISAEKIAARFGKSVQYVYDRIALQRCTPEIQERLRDGQIGFGVAKQFAKLDPEDQGKLWQMVEDKATDPELGVSAVPASVVRKIVQETFSLNLEKAPFDTESAELLPKAGACTTCPRRSGCSPLLFDDIKQTDICFDKVCYDEKVEANIQFEVDRLAKMGYRVFKCSMRYANTGDEIQGLLHWHNDFLKVDDFEPATASSEDERKFLGVVMEPGWDGAGKGSFFYITLHNSAKERLGIAEEKEDDGEGNEGGESQGDQSPGVGNLVNGEDAEKPRRFLLDDLGKEIIKSIYEKDPAGLSGFDKYEAMLLINDIADCIESFGGDDNFWLLKTLLEWDTCPYEFQDVFEFLRDAFYTNLDFDLCRLRRLWAVVKSTLILVDTTYWMGVSDFSEEPVRLLIFEDINFWHFQGKINAEAGEEVIKLCTPEQLAETGLPEFAIDQAAD